MQSQITYFTSSPLASYRRLVRFLATFFALIFVISGSIGQDLTKNGKNSIDSIIKIAPKTVLEIEQAIAHYQKDTIQLDYFIKASALKNYQEGLVVGLNNLGIRYRQLSRFDKSLEKHKLALEAAQQTNNIDLQVYSLNMLAVIYMHIDALTLAVDNAYEAIELAESVQQPNTSIQHSISFAHNTIGQINRILGLWDLAIDQFEKAMALEEALGNKLGLSSNYQNIGECQEAQGMLQEALESYEKANAINKELNYARGKIICNNGIAHVFIHEDKILEAESMLRETLQEAETLGEHFLIASVQLTLGWALSELEKFEEAEFHLRKGLELARTYNMLRIRVEAYDKLSDLWAKRGDYKQALKYYRTSLDVESQIKNDQNIRYVYSSIIRKDNEARVSSMNQQLRKNNTRLLVSGIVLALLSGIFYILYRQYQLKNDKKLLTLEQSMLRSQMNPHFLFNSLNSIKLYIINNEQKNAVHYLNKFSKLVRKILESSSMREIPLAEELETVELYMNIENIRFSNEIDFKVSVDKNIDPHTVRIPSLILQPFLENALWHGLSSKSGEKKIELNIYSKIKDYIDISITDNGIGRQAAERIKQNKVLKRKSVGIEITKERLANFSKDLLNTFEVEIVDLFDDNGNAAGTQVILHIPMT